MFRGPFRRPWKTSKKVTKSEFSPTDAMILLETFEEKIFICTSNGTVVLSTLGSKVKGVPIEEAIANFHAVPQSYSITLRRCIQLVCQSSQKIWFQTPLLDYEAQPAGGSASSLNFSSEITTTIKPFRKLVHGDGGTVAITISFSESPSSLTSQGCERNPFDLEISLGSLSTAMDTSFDRSEVFYPPMEPTYNFSMDGVFRSIAKALAETFQMRYGWISRVVETAPWRVQIVTFWDDKQQAYLPSVEYDLEGSFWGLVGQNEGVVSYPNNALTLFPLDSLLSQYQIESLVFSSAKITHDPSQGAMYWIGAMNTSPTSWQQPVLKSVLGHMTQRVEEQLTKLKKQHHYWMSDQVLKQMSDAVIILDTSGRVVQWKGTAEQLFCMKADEVRGNPIKNLLASEKHFSEFTDWLTNASSRIGPFEAERDSRKTEITFRKKDGWFEGEMSCKIIRLDIPILVLIVVRDVTERIRRNEELKTLCNLLEKSRDDALAGIRMKSLFLANVSHEIRTPMNAIIGMTQLLLDTDLSDSQKELVEDIRGSGDHLIAIINDILDISKLEAGKIVLERQEISVRKCIEDAYRLTSRSFPNSKGRIDFKSEIRSDVPETIIGDSTRLTQILINLLSNAMKFTQHGFIRVSVSHATGITPSGPTIATPQTHYDPAKRSSAAYVPISPDAIELLFVIQDSGIGIPAHALDRIFEPFEQSDTSSIRKYGGTGLGLSICARLVQCMGGKIWAESEQENGSTFSFTIMALASNTSTNPTRRDPGHNYVNMNGGGTGGDSETESPSPSASQRKPAAPSGTDSRIAHSSPSPETPSPVVQSINPKSIAAVSARLASMGSLLNVSGTLVEPVKDHSSLSILVAEDNLMNQKVILKLLSKIGCKPDLACNGVEAVEAATKKHYDVVFMDVQMPEMDGIEATRCITAMAPHTDHNPPVIIALTANVCEPDQISRYHASGMIHILAKPIKLNLLEEVLNNIPQFLEKMQERDRKWLEESTAATKASSRPPSLGLPSSSLPSTPASSASSSPCSLSCATPVSSTPSPISTAPAPTPPPVASTPSPPGPLLSPAKGSLSTPALSTPFIAASSTPTHHTHTPPVSSTSSPPSTSTTSTGSICSSSALSPRVNTTPGSVVTIQRLPEPTASKTKRRSLGNIAAILTTSPFSPSPSQRLNPSSSPPKPQRSLIGPSSVSGSNLITSFNQSLGIGVGGNNAGSGSNNNNNVTGNGNFNLAPPPLESNTTK